MYKIPVYQPCLEGNEKQYVNECLDSTWISSKGKFISKFEENFSKYIDVPYVTAVSNGTVALHLALLALGIGPGDEVIVPTLTYVASVNAIAYTRATPIFVDSLESTWQMNPQEVIKKLNSRTKAIMAVHLYGHPCEMDVLVEIAKKHHLFLIEDCAEAFGTKYNNEHVGRFGDIATFNFFGNKTITTGEGGMCVTKDPMLHDRMHHFKGQGLAKDKEYWHDVIGYNYRMTNICAAIGLAQLERADDLINKKRQLANWYKEGFKDSSVVFHAEIGNVKHSYWMNVILIKEREKVRSHLANKGIETRPIFYPIHTMPMYFRAEYYPIAESLGKRGICLPSWPALSKNQIEMICTEIFNCSEAL